MQDQKKINFMTYYTIFLRYKRLFIVPFIVVFSIVMLSSLFFPKVYESSTVIRVQKKQPNPIGNDRLVREDDLRAQLITLQEFVLSRPNLIATIRKLNLDQNERSANGHAGDQYHCESLYRRESFFEKRGGFCVR
jgi:uncharacterized protein involved in exopolysaccharide biosynthesis